MKEEARQTYLKVMGIQTYFPRIAFSNAKAAPSLKFSHLTGLSSSTRDAEIVHRAKPTFVAELPQSKASDQDTDPVKHASDDVTKNQQGKNEPQAKGMLSEIPLQLAEKVAVETIVNKSVVGIETTFKKVAKETSSTENSSDALRFNLRYYRINQELAVISEIPHLQNNSHQKEALTLLRAILAALGVDPSNCSFTPESFDWPLAENLSMKNDPKTEASNALRGFLKVRHVQDGFHNLLILSNQLEELLLPRWRTTTNPSGNAVNQVAAVEVTHDFELDNEEVICTLVTSVQSMLSMPLLKREAWKQMQALRQRIAANHTLIDSADSSVNLTQSIF